jgi:hypothetical protein
MTGTERDPDEAPGKAGEADPAPQGGVLGNLPKKRPAVRSPRRARAGTAGEAEPASEGTKAKPEKERPAKKRPATPTGARPEQPDEPARQDPEHSHAADLEELARGGIAIAGGAASLGLRIAGRAAAALRDAVERR